MYIIEIVFPGYLPMYMKLSGTGEPIKMTTDIKEARRMTKNTAKKWSVEVGNIKDIPYFTTVKVKQH